MKFGGAALSTASEIQSRAKLIEKYFLGNEIIIISLALKGVADSLLNLINHTVKEKNSLKSWR